MSTLEVPLLHSGRWDASSRLSGSADLPTRWRWTGEDLVRLGNAGILPPEGRFEVLQGEIYQLIPPGPLHAYIVELIVDLLKALVQAEDLHTRSQNPVRMSAEYEPQPDIALIRGRREEYQNRFPGPDAVLLVVEVADSSLDYDRKLKLPAYGGAGIAEYWLVNLPEQQVEVYREPDSGGYRSLRIYRKGEVLEPLALPGPGLAVDALLGNPPTADNAGAERI